MIKTVDQMFERIIERYNNGDRDAFNTLPYKMIARHLDEIGKKPPRTMYTHWLYDLITDGTVTFDEVKRWTKDYLADQYLCRVQNTYITKRMIHYKDMAANFENVSKELQKHPKALIRYIRALTDFDRNFLRMAWGEKENYAALLGMVSYVIEHDPRNKKYENKPEDTSEIMQEEEELVC